MIFKKNNIALKFILLCFVCLNAHAQQVPLDKALKKGQLSNGMTYYIRHNNEFPGHADFHIFHAVGAIQEEDNQNGLAHFLEHIAFKGTKHLPDNQLLDYMEINGVKFGPNLNAATSYDYTHYMLRQIPTSRQGMVDTCLLVLSDWSGSILATQEAIDFERGVIREEYRSRSDLNSRINAAMTPFYFKGSKYAKRNIIGDMDIISNFKREELLDFYKTWYRPDLQAIVVIGDIDVDKMEKVIIDRFSKLENPLQPRKKEIYTLPDNTQPIVAKYLDAEIGEPSIGILFKHPKKSSREGSLKNYISDYIDRVIISMMNSRWQELSEQDGFAVKHIGFSYSDFIADKDVFAISAGFKKDPGTWSKGLDEVLYEAQRFRKLGFHPEELKRAKAEFVKQLESQQKESGKLHTNSLVQSYLQNFLTGAPVSSVDYKYNLFKTVLDSLSLDHVNKRVKDFYGKQNQIVTLIAPQQDSAALFNEQDILARLANMEKLTVNEYQSAQTVKLTPKKKPVAGYVVSEEKSPFGSITWKLSNGAEVTVLPTAHKQDEVLITAFSKGGQSRISDNELQSSFMLTSHMSNTGVGNLDAIALKKALADHTVYATPFLTEFEQGFSCMSSPKDFEVLLTLVYMHLTEQRFDDKILQRDLQRFAENMSSRGLNPMATLQDSVMLARYNNHARSLAYLRDSAAVNLTQLKKLYADHFGNPANFKWMITGNVDLKTIKPMIEKYIGGLTKKQAEGSWKDLGKYSPDGVKKVDFNVPMESPKSITFIEYTKKHPFELKNLVGLRMLKNIVDIRLKVLLRDDKSGVYTTDGEGSISEFPLDKMQFIVSFQSDPQRMDELTTIVFDELNRLAKDGVNADDLLKSKEYMKKAQQNQLDNNYYWQSMLYGYLNNKRDKHTKMLETIESIKAGDLNALLRELIGANNLVHVTMRPTEGNKGVHFEDKLSWKEIVEKAKKEDKYVFVDCYTTWCGPCKQMAQEVFPLEKMGNFFNDRFVNVKIQMDKTKTDGDYVKEWYSTADSLAKLYEVKNYPTFLIFNPEGQLMHRIVAGDEADEFIAKVKLGLDSTTALYPLEAKYAAGDRNLSVLRNLTFAYKNSYQQNRVDELVNVYYKHRSGRATQEDIDYAVAFCKDVNSKSFQFIRKNRSLAEEHLGKEKVNDFLASHVMASEVYVHYQKGMETPVAPILKKAQKKYPDISLEKAGLRMKVRQAQFKKDEEGRLKLKDEFRRLFPNERLQ